MIDVIIKRFYDRSVYHSCQRMGAVKIITKKVHNYRLTLGCRKYTEVVISTALGRSPTAVLITNEGVFLFATVVADNDK